MCDKSFKDDSYHSAFYRPPAYCFYFLPQPLAQRCFDYDCNHDCGCRSFTGQPDLRSQPVLNWFPSAAYHSCHRVLPVDVYSSSHFETEGRYAKIPFRCSYCAPCRTGAAHSHGARLNRLLFMMGKFSDFGEASINTVILGLAGGGICEDMEWVELESVE